ncbi:ABC transporter permease [Lentibacillus saliphilus]|uniref:ABC transporter permease n=1 Tax=Lentibacillus saliphilus TaxID=2737028 RepID=UPI001C307B1D|nr:ABC transporter permease [Lentibacillus saliphilus]
MLKVNSKKAINYLVKSSLKQYKMRNLFTIITIVLSVSLIAGLAFLSSAIEETERKELSTRQHVIYHNVNDKQISALKSHSQISFEKDIKRGQSFEQEDYIITPYYIEQNDSPFITVDIAEGRYPEQINEVLVYDQMLVQMGIKPRVGQSMSITYLDGTTEDYTVSGLLTAETTDVFPVYFSREYALSGSQLKDVPFDLSAQIEGAEKMGSEEFLSVIRGIGAGCGIDRKNINENNAFLRSLTYNYTEVIMIALLAFAILLVSVLVIYSIFYISISERTRQFGQLRTIGMTKKQVKRMVRKEGAVLSLIGSVIGIIIGAVFAFSMKPQGFSLDVFALYAIAIFAANFITVQVSIAKPAKLAASISPIEATRMSGYEVKNKKKQTKNLQRKLSPLSLSMISTKGNRKKSMMTIISLSLAGIVFMSASSYVDSMNAEEFSRESWFKFGEYTINISSNAAKVNDYGDMGIKANNPLNDTLIENLQAVDGVKKVIAMQTLSVNYTYNDVTKKDVAAPFTKDDAGLMSQYLKAGSIDYEKMIENKEIIIAHNEIAKEIFGWDFKVGDTVSLKWYNGENEVEDVFTIAGILQPSTTLYRNQEMFRLAHNAGWFMMPQGLLDTMMTPKFNLNTRIIVSTEDYWNTEERIEKEILSFTANNPLVTLSTLKSEMENDKQLYSVIYFTFMGAALFVIAFSIINLLNTLISNTMARKREFACLGAIGASNRQIKIMIIGEGMYFAAVNLIVTVTIGTLMGYALVKFAKWNGVSFLVYQFPLTYLLGYCLFVLLGTLAISAVISKVLSKKSLIERLRKIE